MKKFLICLLTSLFIAVSIPASAQIPKGAKQVCRAFTATPLVVKGGSSYKIPSSGVRTRFTNNATPLTESGATTQTPLSTTVQQRVEELEPLSCETLHWPFFRHHTFSRKNFPQGTYKLNLPKDNRSLAEMWGLLSYPINSFLPAHVNLLEISKLLDNIKFAIKITPEQAQRLQSSHPITATSSLQLTPKQLQRVQEAEIYFRSLTLEEASQFDVQFSPEFRKHASVLRAPQATEYAYYIQGSGFENIYQQTKEYNGELISEEEGYIPYFIGDPEKGCTLTQINQVFSNAPKTDKPLFVQVAAHGNTDTIGRFRVYFNGEPVYTQSLIASVQRLRQQTGAPEVNVQIDSCSGGACLLEFSQLPAEQREGINLFVLAGTNNYNYTDAFTLAARSRGNTSYDIALNLTAALLKSIASGKLLVGAHIRGQLFMPLTDTIKDPRLSSIGRELYSLLLEEQTTFMAYNRNSAQILDNLLNTLRSDERYIRPIYNAAVAQGRRIFGPDFDRLLAEEDIHL